MKNKIDFFEENHRIKGIQVSSNDTNNCSYCGKYRLIKRVDANIELSAYAIIHTDTKAENLLFKLLSFNASMIRKIFV